MQPRLVVYAAPLAAGEVREPHSCADLDQLLTVLRVLAITVSD